MTLSNEHLIFWIAFIALYLIVFFVDMYVTTHRKKPMSVGISSHLVTYDRNLQGANDGGNKEAEDQRPPKNGKVIGGSLTHQQELAVIFKPNPVYRRTG